MFGLIYNLLLINTKGAVCMEKTRTELVELIKKIEDEKLLNNLKLIVSGYILNEKK